MLVMPCARIITGYLSKQIAAINVGEIFVILCEIGMHDAIFNGFHNSQAIIIIKRKRGRYSE